jgi:hypothetical protein
MRVADIRVNSSYVIPNAGNYDLEISVTNWQDTKFDSGLALDDVSIGGVSITPPAGGGGPPPVSTAEPT